MASWTTINPSPETRLSSMTQWTLIARSLRYYARSHLGALLGSAIGSAVLIGALAVGDSVRGSLRDMALARLGKIQWALSANDRFLRADLASDLSRSERISVAPAIQLQGTAALSDGSARANRVQVIGVDASFWSLSQRPVSFPPPGPDEVVINQPLADQLRVKVGDPILVRVEKPSRLSREAPISPQEDFALALRVKVRAIAPDDQMGRFSLQANQVAPKTAFLPLKALTERLQLPGRANLLLVSQEGSTSMDHLEAGLRQDWQLADAELELRSLPDTNGAELRSDRVFIDPPVANAALRATPAASGILTYFVNELRAGDHRTPYSMVTAMGTPVVPSEMRDDEILINPWLAEDLNAKPADRISLSYFTIGTSRRLEEHTNEFSARAVIPIAGAAADRMLMPDFPGLEKAESTRDWDSSLPIKLERIRPKDEEYWRQYRGTPKAFVTLAAGQKMWSNRFGNLTSIRFQPGLEMRALSNSILHSLDPATLGLHFDPVRQQAEEASEQGQDFAQLFLGFSFFLIVAALLLMALLFQFGIERRATEVGTLMALGFTPKQVRRLLLWEASTLTVAGALLGLPGGILYARAMLLGLSTIWRTSVGTAGLQFHTNPMTMTGGAGAGIFVSILTLWIALRKQACRPARELLAEGAASEFQSAASEQRSRGIWIGWLASASAMLVVGWAGLQQQAPNPEMFFMAGTLLLISGIGFAAAVLKGLGFSQTAGRPSLSAMGLRNMTRRRRRSLSTIGLLACGSFLVAAIGVFKLDSSPQSLKRTSGTGGFGLMGESALSIVQDLNSEEGRQFFGLSSNDLPGVRFVSFRLHEGEDASCLNLNRAQRPRLLGVRPELLSQRGAFTFTQVADGYSKEDPWRLLLQTLPNGAVPAIADAATIEWGLGKKLGDTIPYVDERGQTFQVRLVAAVANSILQGSLVIAEPQLLLRFPSESGYRVFLIDLPSKDPIEVDRFSTLLTRATQDYGMELTPAWKKLAAFNAVQNTYLNTFEVLGGLGLLLGSVGLGIVVLRNVLERRSELGLLQAVGFRPGALRWMVLSEHAALLMMGLFIGLIAAGVAVLPTLMTPGAEIPVRSMVLTLGGMMISGLVWTWIATQIALRGNLLTALRDE